MNSLCDLHTHSIYSDGTCTPEELLQQADAHGYYALALTDHNTVSGLPSFLEAAKSYRVKAICGAEFSVNYKDKELHLLGLFLPVDSFPAISEKMLWVNEQKTQSNLQLIENLNRSGYAVDVKKLADASPTGMFNRAHIAQELVRLGHVASVEEAFQTLLHRKNSFYTEPERLEFFHMTDFLRRLGAAPVLAHPMMDLSVEELEAFLPVAKETGLLGMEVAYSRYARKDEAAAMQLAEKYRLLPSGGSDYHGDVKPDIRLGCGKGALQIPTAWAYDLEMALP